VWGINVFFNPCETMIFGGESAVVSDRISAGDGKLNLIKNLDDQGINLNFSTGVDRFAIWYHSIQELL